MESQSSSDDIVVRNTAAALTDQFARLDRSQIEATVQRHFTELRARARITTFVGIIAERHARAELQTLDGSSP